MKGEPRDRVIVALDVPDIKQAEDLVSRLSGRIGFFKVGHQLFSSCGPKAVEMVKASGGRVFLDLKYHDIPNTVAGAVESAVGLGADIVNVHASGGSAMMMAAAKSAERARAGRPDSRILLLGVTVLTSLGQQDLEEIAGCPGRTPQEQVLHLAAMARKAGLDGVVASPREIEPVRRQSGNDFVILTPGIRPSDSPPDDQQRTATPGEAFRLGADFIVVGRPITAAADPVAAAEKIITEIEHAFEG